MRLLSTIYQACRPGLADRAIVLTLPPISDAQRRSEAELWADFERARAGILGALLDVMAHGLSRRFHVRRATLPRMADFALWAAACVARAYAANRRTMIEVFIDADPVAACVRDMMASRNQWTGTASDFLLAADKLQRQ